MMHPVWKKLIECIEQTFKTASLKSLKAKETFLVRCKHVNPLFHFCFVTCVITGNSSFVNFLICEIKLIMDFIV